MTFNEKANKEKNRITRAMAIISFALGCIFPIMEFFSPFDAPESLSMAYNMFIMVIGYYAGRRIIQDVSEKKYIKDNDEGGL